MDMRQNLNKLTPTLKNVYSKYSLFIIGILKYTFI